MTNVIDIRRITEHVGAEVTGVDLREPVNDGIRRQLTEALVRNGMLVVRNQRFDARQFLTAGSQFGEPMAHEYSSPLENLPLVQRLSSHARNANGTVRRTGPRWHTDQADHEVPPKFTALYAIELFRTGGGSTGFANMRAAFDALPDGLKRRIEGLQGVYVARTAAAGGDDDAENRVTSEPATMRPVIHPLVRTNPDTGLRAIYFHPHRIKGIVGLPPGEASALLSELLARALQAPFLHDHHWSLGDLVLWDNRSMLHKANYDYDPTDTTQHRCMYRMLVRGERPQ